MTERPTIAARLLGSVHPAQEGHRVTNFELLFDLVFVFAFTQVSGLMSHGHSAISVLQAMVVLGLLWWSWVSYGWLTNQAQGDRGILRAGLAVAMALIFVLALAIPDAFHHPAGELNAATVLVVCYALVRLVHTALYVVAAGDDRALRLQVLRTNSLALLPSVVLLVVGVLIGEPAQTWIWLAAWLVDVAMVWLTSRGGDWRLHSVSHWTERHGLVVMLALGESVVAIGVGVTDRALSIPIVVGAVLAVAGAVVLWWLYFHRIAAGGEHALARRSGIARVEAATLAYTYLHYLVVAGVILTALGIEQTMAHIDSTEPLGLFGAAALAGGVSLYQTATVFFWRYLTGRWLVVRLVLSTALLPGIALAAVLPAMAALAVAVLLGAVLIAVEGRTGPEMPAVPAPRPGES